MGQRVRIAAVAAAMACVVGCNPDVRTCDDVSGQFLAQYTYLPSAQAPATDCSIDSYRLTIDGGNSGVKRTTTRYGNQDIITSVTLKGCTVGLDVEVNRRNGGSLIARMSGDMEVVNADLLSGTVQGRAVEDNGSQCEGFFRATLSRQGGLAGAAAPIAPPPTVPVAPPTVAPPAPALPPSP